MLSWSRDQVMRLYQDHGPSTPRLPKRQQGGVMAHIPVAERRAALVAAAWRVMASDGLAAATTRAICAEAGMPQGAFHYCFASRDELLREVATGLLPDEVGAVSAVIGCDGSLVDTVTDALMAYWSLVERD